MFVFAKKEPDLDGEKKEQHQQKCASDCFFMPMIQLELQESQEIHSFYCLFFSPPYGNNLGSGFELVKVI